MKWLQAHWSKVISGLAIAAVAGVAGVVSYMHIYELTLTLHQPVIVARLMPFGVDGLIVSGSVVLLQAAAEMPWLGWLGVGPGVVISLFANVESGITYGLLPAIWAGVPAVAFFLATFILERWFKSQAGHAGLRQSGAASCPPGGELPHRDAAPADVPAVPDPPAVLNGHSFGSEWTAASTSGWS